MSFDGCYLAVVELLDDSFTLFADITDANEFRLAVTSKEAAANPLDHSSGRASAGHAAVLDVPEDAHWREVLRPAILWRPWQTVTRQSFKVSCRLVLKVKEMCPKLIKIF